METVPRKRIEILADAPLVPRVLAALRQSGVPGHTIIPALSGAGRTGSWSEGEITGATKQLVIAIASAEHARAFVDAIGPLLTSHQLLLSIADVAVVRGERF